MDTAISVISSVINRNDSSRNQDGHEEGSEIELEDVGERIKRWDFVLTFPRVCDDVEVRLNRNRFEEEMEKAGLLLHRPKPSDEEGYPLFLLVHVPFEVMEEYAEKLEIRKPLKGKEAASKKCASSKKHHHIDHSLTPYRQNSLHRFKMPREKEDFFTSSERAQVVWHIMRRIDYGKPEEKGINYLLASKKTYLDAYHLHEDFSKKDDDDNEKPHEEKPHPLEDWAKLRKFRHNQPLDEIREYFGEEVALYFAWLGTYTQALILPALVGICCFVYGLLRMNSSEKTPMEDVCYGEIGKQKMCALCSDGSCSEEKLNSSCGTRFLLLLFDNNATVFMSMFTSFWATGFLIYWQRTQTRLTLKWGGEAMLSAGGSDRDTWELRPEYKRPKKKDSGKSDNFPQWERLLKILASLSVVMLMAAAVVGALLGIMAFSISLRSSLYLSENEFISKNSKTLTSFTTAVINLIIIIVLDSIYYRVAVWLTNLENPKTQADYDRSYVMKVYVFEFFNCYSSLFYIAFVKGHLYTYPGDPAMSTTLLAQDTCDSGSCLAELLIQLLVIMGGKQVFNLFLEIIFPRVKRWIKRHKIVLQVGGSTNTPKVRERERWEKDYHLSPENPNIFCQEILEIVIQYGFVTLFVAAFPLAPLFALINNVAEIRVDADKLLTQYRRALPRRIKKLASWDSIQHAVTYLAVAINGCIIAFTSEFIPRLFYTTTISEDHSLTGYVNFSLSVYQKESPCEGSPGESCGICRYRGFREPPSSTDQYLLSPHYWHIQAMQLLFVIVFEHVVLGVSSFVAYFIPEVPRSVEEEAHEEREMTREEMTESRTVEANEGLEMVVKGDDPESGSVEVHAGHEGGPVSTQVGRVINKLQKLESGLATLKL